MAKKNNNANQPAETEKKMTKYDLKMQRRKEAAARQKKNDMITKCICGAIVLACVAGVAYKVYDKYDERNGAYILVGDHKIQKEEFDYYYYNSINSFYSNYGSYASYFGLDFSKPLDQQSYSDEMTWMDYFKEQACDQLQEVYSLADAADANGFEYDATERVATLEDSIKEGAEEAEQSVDEYLTQIYGEYAKMDDIKGYSALAGKAYAYYDELDKAVEVSDDEINAYYEEHAADYDSVDYMVCNIAADMPEEETEDEAPVVEEETEAVDETAETETLTAEEQALKEAEEAARESEEAEKEAELQAQRDAALAAAKETADQMQSEITDEASFKTLFEKYTTDDAAVTDYVYKNVTQDEVDPSELADWLFEDGRKAGDTTVIESDNEDGYYVAYFMNRYLDHKKTVDVRHILINSDAETTEEMTAEEITKAQEEANAAAKAKAEEIYAEWKAGDATEDSFAELAKEKSEDTGSQENGGLYEAVKEGDMVDSFNDWIFDPSRKPGDTDIVETSYGYHIMYFVGDNAESWYVDCKENVHHQKLDEQLEALKENYKITDKRADLKYLTISHDEEVEETE